MKINQTIIWRITDQKKGHDIQSLSLCNSLKKLVKCEINSLTRAQAWIKLIKFVLRKDKIQRPVLVVAAGHRTHLVAFMTKLLLRAKSLVIMKPTLPIYFFDLCLIPNHDNLRNNNSGNVIRFHGALNNLRDLGRHDELKGLILIGGSSRHFNWNNEFVIRQILEITEANLSIQYSLTNSPRTPKDFYTQIKNKNITNLNIFNYSNVPDTWIKEKLYESKNVWVTKDSVSMIYESLTAGCDVGIIELKEKGNNKIYKSVNNLIELKIVRFFSKKIYKKRKIIFNETDRCAVLVKLKLLNNNQ